MFYIKIMADAWYFCNALVRANYNDLKNDVHETTMYLEKFLKNLLLDEKNKLSNREMHISSLFSDASKQDIEESKQDIDIKKIFEEELISASFSLRSVRNIERLYLKYKNKVVFGRTDIINELAITASPASELIKKLLNAGIIIPVRGKGKGKYIFSK